MEASGTDGRRPHWHQWSAPSFEVGSNGAVPAGVDGEALTLEAPLRFAIHAGALRVRLAPHHPGASPSAALPEGLIDGIRKTVKIASGANPPGQ
jgi:hypothetical protein